MACPYKQEEESLLDQAADATSLAIDCLGIADARGKSFPAVWREYLRGNCPRAAATIYVESRMMWLRGAMRNYERALELIAQWESENDM